MTQDMLQKGYEYQLRHYIPIGPDEDGSYDFYICSSTAVNEINEADVEQYRNANYRTFDQFAENIRRIWKVSMQRNIVDWTTGTCTCPSYDLKCMCKHVIAMAIELGALPQNQENFDNEPLFQSKRGRPKAVKPGSALSIE